MTEAPEIRTKEQTIKDYTISIPNIRSYLFLHWLTCHPLSTLTEMGRCKLYEHPRGYQMSLSSLTKKGLVASHAMQSDDPNQPIVMGYRVTQAGRHQLRLISNYKVWAQKKIGNQS